MATQFRNEWTAYEVHGETLEAAASAIAQMREAATAEWFPRYDYKTTGGRLTSVSVTVVLRVTLPRWVEYVIATRPEQAEWDRFCRALRAHEQGHLDLAVLHLQAIDEQMVGRGPDAAKRAWDAALAALADASREYDRATDHGRRHGTVIDAAVSDFTEVSAAPRG